MIREAKYTRRLVIKMTPEDMNALEKAAKERNLPPTVLCRLVILEAINPIFKK